MRIQSTDFLRSHHSNAPGPLDNSRMHKEISHSRDKPSSRFFNLLREGIWHGMVYGDVPQYLLVLVSLTVVVVVVLEQEPCLAVEPSSGRAFAWGAFTVGEFIGRDKALTTPMGSVLLTSRHAIREVGRVAPDAVTTPFGPVH